MTALDVMCYLERLKVQLTLTPELELRYRAPRGVMTHVLQGTLKTCKGPLVQLLLTGKAAPLPKGVSLPETDYRQFLTWQTGKVPECAAHGRPLPEPQYHDVPSPPETAKGQPCPTQGCQPTTTFARATRESVLHMDRALCGVPRAGEGCVEDFRNEEQGHDLRLFDDLQTQAWKALGKQGSAWCARPQPR